MEINDIPMVVSKINEAVAHTPGKSPNEQDTLLEAVKGVRSDDAEFIKLMKDALRTAVDNPAFGDKLRNENLSAWSQLANLGRSHETVISQAVNSLKNQEIHVDLFAKEFLIIEKGYDPVTKFGANLQKAERKTFADAERTLNWEKYAVEHFRDVYRSTRQAGDTMSQDTVMDQNDKQFWSSLATYKNALEATKSLHGDQRDWARHDAQVAFMEVLDKLSPGQKVEYHGRTDVSIEKFHGESDKFGEVILRDSLGSRWAEGIENLVRLKKELQLENNRDLNNTHADKSTAKIGFKDSSSNAAEIDGSRPTNPYVQTRQAGTTLSKLTSQDNSGLARVASGNKKLSF